ncbi:class C sortase [Streptococcus pseudoporcinus]|uniref:Sortase family protein n=2 Tax=Streptococcus pseudoporcinus TaxID=361101 RepID=G5K9J4_9STRE|nr:class C sortase [Streptococcus pseudoporcinus]EFR43699.1 sortase family protein [Streptococcus pseudoporcinus SPIN 20026]EHI65254.1 sortase family protein [Streptococcus pseudoporcinus LQ 940-04]VEF93664.1 sortase [Streptococcus pseudoporcinus]VTS40884.1 sortase [Streptococcus pseudoporcinus]
MTKKKQDIVSILLVTIIAIGIGLMAYPSLANYWNSFHQSNAIMDYQERVTHMDTKDYGKVLQRAKQYNKQFETSGMKWRLTEEERQDYNSQLAIDKTGNMGYISIPKINVKLPLYHGTTEKVLQTSIGHLEGSSLPIGGKSTHSILSGHRGLPSSRLFSDLDKLRVGDRWTVNVLNETFTYEVDQIRTVEPDDLRDLQIVKGKDYQTLVTCTPYGINTHRLLVRGHRVSNANGNALIVAEAIQIDPIYIAPFFALLLIVLLLLIFLEITRRSQKRKAILQNTLGKKLKQ